MEEINVTQPTTTESVPIATPEERHNRRNKLPDERPSITHKFSIDAHKGYITAGLYENGQPGEIFLTIAKEGSTVSGLMDAFATAVSIGLQYGVPLEVFASKFVHSRFEPSGFTKNPEIPMAKSLVDYVFRWLVSKFCSLEEKMRAGIVLTTNNESVAENHPDAEIVRIVDHGDGVMCRNCGGLTRRNGSCHVCTVCGETTGCS